MNRAATSPSAANPIGAATFPVSHPPPEGPRLTQSDVRCVGPRASCWPPLGAVPVAGAVEPVLGAVNEPTPLLPVTGRLVAPGVPALPAVPVLPVPLIDDVEGSALPPAPKGDEAARSSVSALAPPNSRLRLPPPESTPMPMSPMVTSLAKLQSALRSALTSASRTGCTLFSLAPTTCCPSALSSMPTMRGVICTVPSDRVVCVGHCTLSPIGDSAVLMMLSTLCGFAPLLRLERSRGTPATVSEPMEKVPVAVVAPPDCCVAFHCSPPRTTAPLPREICPMSDVAVAVRVAPLSMEACALDVSPLTASIPPGTEMLEAVVSEPDDGCVVAVAASFPRPRPSGEDCGVMLSERF